MPRAEMNLREHLSAAGNPLALDDAVSVIKDVSDALVDLDGKVVHREPAVLGLFSLPTCRNTEADRAR